MSALRHCIRVIIRDQRIDMDPSTGDCAQEPEFAKMRNVVIVLDVLGLFLSLDPKS